MLGNHFRIYVIWSLGNTTNLLVYFIIYATFPYIFTIYYSDLFMLYFMQLIGAGFYHGVRRHVTMDTYNCIYVAMTTLPLPVSLLDPLSENFIHSLHVLIPSASLFIIHHVDRVKCIQIHSFPMYCVYKNPEECTLIGETVGCLQRFII